MRRAHIVLLLVAVVALAGCVGGTGGDGGDGANGVNETDGNQSDVEMTAAVAVGIGDNSPPGVLERLNLSQSDRLLLQQAQQSSGNLSEEEQRRVGELQQDIQQAQQEMRQEEQQAVEENRNAFESAVNSTETLSIDDSIDQSSSSLFLVTGSPSEILELLEEDGVEGILSQSRYEELREQRQQQAPRPGGPPRR
jgi:TolA-binding protein